MPTIVTRGAASANGFGAFASLGGGYWIGNLFTSNASPGYSITADSVGNAYAVGTTNSNGGFVLIKINPSGVIQWQKNVFFNGLGVSVAVDSSGNPHICGYLNNGCDLEMRFAKLDTSGTLQLQRSYNASGQNDYAYSISVDSSGNIYVFGIGVATFVTFKVNSSGTMQWQRILSGTGAEGISMSADSSGNVYVIGRAVPLYATNAVFVKYNTSGTLQWQRQLSPGGSNVFNGQGITADSSGNVYICGYSNVTGFNGFCVAKYNSSGTLQWQRLLSTSYSMAAFSIASDFSGNVYICGQGNVNSGSNALVIAKYNTSGVIQWQRYLRSTAGEIYGRSISVNSKGDVFVLGSGSKNGFNSFFMAKLPSDGSRTGTYTLDGATITYDATSATDSALTFTSSTSTLTDSTTSQNYYDPASAANNSALSYNSVII